MVGSNKAPPLKGSIGNIYIYRERESERGREREREQTNVLLYVVSSGVLNV